MQTRIAFNSGEFTPEMAYRSDMDQYGRACETLENWEVSQMGGLKRRKGMRVLTSALSEKSRLIPYIYSYSADGGQRFLVELSEEIVRVLGYEGEEIARFTSGVDGTPVFYYEPIRCYYKQINNLLIITALNVPPMVLKRNSDDEWVFELWKFKQQMWRHNYEQRDYPITITKEDDTYSVAFDENEDENEKFLEMSRAEYLRSSFWTEQQETNEPGIDLRANVEVVEDLEDALSKENYSIPQWKRYAVASEITVQYFVCTRDWKDSDFYTPSLESPLNYPNNFAQAENGDGYEDVTPVWSIHDISPDGTIKKDTKVAINTAYWEYYTCVKEFSSTPGETTEKTFSDYPGYFIKGIAVGKPLACRGEWSFYCSGVWFGCYEVRRKYDDSILDENWEQRGMSFSRNESATNLLITGTEADEACYLRLFLTKSRRMTSENDIAPGFVQDSCGNRLIVQPYKHDLVLKCIPTLDSDGAVTSINWECADKVTVDWGSSRKITDWSWQAFSGRYGYPLLCEVYNKRLVFASTDDQPQTVWMSRTDDLNNFSTSGSAETAAMALTLNTTSQNPICWLQAQGYRLMLGTSEAEFCISAGQHQGGISNSNAQIEDHSHVGSDGIAALTLNDVVLFVERGSGRVYTLKYNLQIDGYAAQDLSVFAPHIAREHGGIVQMSSIRKPDTVALFVLGDGQLALCTHNTLHEINAWHRWVTDGKVLSVCGMPDGLNDDRIYLIVQRDGVNIEVVDSQSDYQDGNKDYESVVVVNALMDYREGFFGKRASVPSYLCLGADFKIEGDNILVSDNGGKKWIRPPHFGDFLLHKGWNMQFTPTGYKYEVKPAVKVSGNQGITILGIRD